jgi:hypothetical protein
MILDFSRICSQKGSSFPSFFAPKNMPFFTDSLAGLPNTSNSEGLPFVLVGINCSES